MTNNYYPKSLFYPNNYYIVLYYITITISFNYIIFTTFQFVFLSIFVFPCHITASYNHVIISYYCASDFLSVNTVNNGTNTLKKYYSPIEQPNIIQQRKLHLN